MSRKKAALFWAILLAIPVVGLVIVDRLLATVFTDFAMHQSNTRLLVYHDTVGAVHRKNFQYDYRSPEIPKGSFKVKTNNLGLREDSKTLVDSPSKHRVIVFGDSHTDGAVDNPSTFPNFAEKVLQDEGIDAEVLNAGVAGYSFYQQALLLDEWLDLKPDIAVFCLYVGNDYLDILSTQKPHLTEDDDGKISENPPPPQKRKPFLQKLSSHSYFVHRILNLVKKEESDEPPTKVDTAVAIDSGAVWQSLDQAYDFNRTDRFPIASRRHEYVVKRIKKTAVENDIEILFLILPSCYLVQPDEMKDTFSALEELLELDPDNKVDERVRDDFLRITKAQNAECIDLSPHLSELEEPAFWQFDHHLNPIGCRIVGDVLADALRTRLAETK